MSGSHKFEISTNKTFKALEEAVKARMSLGKGEGAEGQAAFEVELRRLTMALEREIHEADFVRMDEDADGIIFNGKRYRKQRDKACGDYQSTAGRLRVPRTVYRERGGRGGETICPLELRLGLVKGWTPTAAQLASEFVAQVPMREAARMLAKTGTLEPSMADLDRVTKVVGEAWEANREAFEVEVREAEAPSLPPPSEVSLILMSLDGVMVPMKDAPRIPGLNKLDQGPKGHREAGCGVIALINSDSDRLHTIRIGRMPESNKITLKNQLISELKNIIQKYPDALIQAVADGAPSNWKIIEEISSTIGKEIEVTLDFFHAFEHICEAFRAHSGKNTEQTNYDIKEWREALLKEENAAKRVKQAIKYRLGRARSKNKRKLLQLKYNYLDKHLHMMNYAELKAANRPIGSGLQEAACKTLVSQRMKGSGMSWSQSGGQAVLTLRAAAQSGRLDTLWKVLTPTLRQEVLVDEDLTRLKPRRLAA